MEARIADLVRWNMCSMVSSANLGGSGLGGHIATGMAWAEIFEVGLNHFWSTEDFVYYQGHSSPALYVRSWLEGRFSLERLQKFRREAFSDQGLSSYPHPLLMHDYWNFPTVSMGLGPLNAIALARFLTYCKLHKILPEQYTNSRVWVFMGDGETDEPEALSSLSIAAREGLDNLVFMVSCNLQRLDSTVRTNGRIIQELEGKFRGAGWNVIKVVHGGKWDVLYERDTNAALLKRFSTLLDADAQRLTVETGAQIRQELFNTPELAALVEDFTDDDLVALMKDTGGHDFQKIYNAFMAASVNNTTGKPTVILFRTIKGKRGARIEAANGTHSEKFLSAKDMVQVKDVLGMPLNDQQAGEYGYVEAPSDVVAYINEHATKLGGPRPQRKLKEVNWTDPDPKVWAPYWKAQKDTSTTLVLGDLLKRLVRDKQLGKTVVPITPDEGRTFGWIGLYGPAIGVYSAVPTEARPVDHTQTLKVHEMAKGRILQEGISEAQGMASMTAWGTAHHNIGVGMIPFYNLYSMFGFQRIHDIVYNAQDSGCRGFFCGATAGGTTLNGEGLQHQDRTSYLVAGTMQNMRAYEPAFAYHVSTVVKNGMKEMQAKDIMYYMMLFNENYDHQAPPEIYTPEALEEAIMKGAHFLNRLSPEQRANNKCVRLLGSGPLLPLTLQAQKVLEEKYGVLSEVVAVTSYTELYREGEECYRWNRKHPGEPPRVPYVETFFGDDDIPTVAHSDWVRKVPRLVAPWIKGKYDVLGCDGCGRSDLRSELRKYFEIDAENVVYSALYLLGESPSTLQQALTDLGCIVERSDRTSCHEGEVMVQGERVPVAVYAERKKAATA
eukprot:TRINITY_DN64650_c0_g2_i2.p1 TRINITY_DN64650_c0_g2~~TRINITY_DN64650_c0_g2_i2.p1  ORF type:complete len:961 (+),score=111.02 TRINITY_DN64650_c0_g2_i2:378-2885(+)